jgi:hypothetical protein
MLTAALNATQSAGSLGLSGARQIVLRNRQHLRDMDV